MQAIDLLITVNIFAFLLAAAWPLVKKVLLMLGVGWLTYQGLEMVASQVVSEIVGQWSALPPSMLQIATLLGIPQSVGIVLGAINARVAFVLVGKLGKVSA